MGLLVTLIIGGIVGWLGSIVMKTNGQMGLIANVVVGIVGASVGSWLAAQFGIVASTGLGSWVVAVVGAMVCIGILKVLGIFS